MPQSERSNIIKTFLRWLEAKSKKGGASIHEIYSHIEVDISEMGASQRSIRIYIQRCLANGLIEIDNRNYKYRVTEKCKNWLKKKV